MDGRKSAGQRPSRTQAASLKNKPSSSGDIVKSAQQLAKPQATASLSASKHSVTRSSDKLSVEQRTVVKNSRDGVKVQTEKQRVHQQASITARGHNVQARKSQQHVGERTTVTNSKDGVKVQTEKQRGHQQASGTARGHNVQASGSQQHIGERTTVTISRDGGVKVASEKQYVKHKEVFVAASGRSVSGRLPTTTAGSSSHSVKK